METPSSPTPAPEVPEAAPQASAATPAPAAEPAPRTLFEPLVHSESPADYQSETSDVDGLFYDEEPQRASGPLSRLFDLARGGFSPRSSAEDVHEAELRQSAHESGFDRLQGSDQGRRETGRGLNTSAQRPALTSISTTPMDGPDMDLDESEMNIPAFLRRQIN